MGLSIQMVVCARDSDKNILADNLARSPDIEARRVPLEIFWNSKSAATAYNRAIESATAEVLVFTHCDVYFPDGWSAALCMQLEKLTEIDPTWAVGGVIGISSNGNLVGRLWDTGLNRVIGEPRETPCQVVAVDEVVLILRRSAGLAFDPNVPDFHMYVADIIFSAERAGRTVYCLDVPVVHNSKPLLKVPAGFVASYRYVAAKWRDRLPRAGIISTLSSSRWPLMFRGMRIRYKGLLRKDTLNFQRLADPKRKAIELGFERP
jgi:Glycosyltransferase like family